MTFAPFATVSLSDIDLVPVEDLPANVQSVPTMMSPPEKSLLYALAKSHFTGEGRIVDAGVFLGGSTVALGRGLIDAGRSTEGKPIILYDQAIVTQGMMDFFARKRLHGDLALGDDLRPEILRNTADVASLVDYRFGDILEETLAPGERIEICFLDLLKTYAICRHAAKEFFPRLIPGRSIVIQQDYFYHLLPYIKVHQECLGDYFDYLGMVRNSAIFRCRKPIPPDVLARDPFAELPADELIALHRAAERRAEIDGGRHFLCALSRVGLIAEIRGTDAAREELEKVIGAFAPVVEADPGGLPSRTIEDIRAMIA